jgi:hypothetical protein
MSNGTTSAARKPVTSKAAAGDSITDNPAVLLAGGVAIGVLIGMLLPRLERERRALDPVGKKLAERATAAVQAVKETGREEVNALLPDRDSTKEKVSALFGNIIEAAKGASAKA